MRLPSRPLPFIAVSWISSPNRRGGSRECVSGISYDEVPPMRIVIVTPAVPHPFGDTAARWFYVLITELLARGHEVVAVAATEESFERIAEAKQWLSKCDTQLSLHCH